MGLLTQLYAEYRKEVQGRRNHYDELAATAADPHQPTVFRRPGQRPRQIFDHACNSLRGGGVR